MTTAIAYTGRGNHGTWQHAQTSDNSETYIHTGTDKVHLEKLQHEAKRKQHTGWMKWMLLGVIGVLALVYAINGVAAADTRTATYQVQPGDTVWSVARHLAPNQDPRSIETKIIHLNHLTGSDMIYPGEMIQVPRV